MATGAIIGATVVKGLSDISAKQKQAKAQKRNAARLQNKATLSLLNGQRREESLRREGSQFESQQVGSFAKSGVAFSGSALNKLTDTSNQIDEDARTLRFNAEVDAQNARDSASELRRSAKAGTSGLSFLSTIGGSVLGGASALSKTGGKTQGVSREKPAAKKDKK